VEWAFLGNWSTKLEYLHYDLGDEATVANGRPGLPAGTCGNAPAFCQVGYNWHTTGDIVRVGLNYKF
jgi:opacity protein-like surface antigen